MTPSWLNLSGPEYLHPYKLALSAPPGIAAFPYCKDGILPNPKQCEGQLPKI